MSYRTTRPRGFIEWTPRRKTREVIEQVESVLAEYGSQQMTIRQVFYRLVTQHEYPKTEKDYSRLCETIGKARRAQLIPMKRIRDDGFSEYATAANKDLSDVVDDIRRMASSVRLDRQEGQAQRIHVWCEARGVAPMLSECADYYGISVFTSGGFDSITAKHNMGAQFSHQGKPIVLHLGDYDPSGVHVFSSLEEDIRAFTWAYGGEVEFERVAVLPDHIEEYDLPTAPPKYTDQRRFDDDRTVQLEAFSPTDLIALLKGEIESRIDMDAFNEQLDKETEVEEHLAPILEAFDGWA
jgi:hypothetical protein